MPFFDRLRATLPLTLFSSHSYALLLAPFVSYSDITKLLSSVAHVLPDIEGIYFNLNDVADHSITYEVRERSIALAKAGERS